MPLYHLKVWFGHERKAVPRLCALSSGCRELGTVPLPARTQTALHQGVCVLLQGQSSGTKEGQTNFLGGTESRRRPYVGGTQVPRESPRVNDLRREARPNV